MFYRYHWFYWIFVFSTACCNNIYLRSNLQVCSVGRCLMMHEWMKVGSKLMWRRWAGQWAVLSSNHRRLAGIPSGNIYSRRRMADICRRVDRCCCWWSWLWWFRMSCHRQTATTATTLLTLTFIPLFTFSKSDTMNLEETKKKLHF